MPKYKIGVDIGGTHTDAVLIDKKKKIIAWKKTATTQPIEIGFSKVLSLLLSEQNVNCLGVEEVLVGTTHALNAILQMEELEPVGLIRLAGHQPQIIPPCFEWPVDLRNIILRDWNQIDGGYECDGRNLTGLKICNVLKSVEAFLKKGIANIAINGVFSPLYPEQEKIVKETIQTNFGDAVSITLGHSLGGIGYIERENAAILNATLKEVMSRGFKDLQKVCLSLGLKCPIFLTQNNGSRLSFESALEFPVLTISAGATNSFIGAAKLADVDNAIVVDIGGTSTDVGVIRNGFPRRQMGNSCIGGVKLNFPIPDVVSIALGGGTLLHDENGSMRLDSKSCGRHLEREAYCFGGKTLTLTDAGAVLGVLAIPGELPKAIPCSKLQAEQILRSAYAKTLALVQKVQGRNQDLPILFVGGGACLFPSEWLDVRCVRPLQASIANAYGAALAEVTATIDKIVALDEREYVMMKLKEEARIKLGVLGGNADAARFVDVQVIPYHYMPGCRARVVVTAASC
jgi:N-methylhydantoinase A/oxoprolinase/acetone carboxylase beta subunit